MMIGEIVVAGCAAAVAACGFVSVRRLKRALREADARLAAYGAESAVLSYGRMTYVDRMPVDENLGDKKPSDEGSGGKKLDGKKLCGKAPSGKRPGEKAAVEALLSVHGLYGGYDQAFENVESFSSRYRIIAPSRFGYLGSSVKGEGTPREQAEAYAELLDRLEIERAFVLGASAGGTPAIRFALDFPERTKGLILYCSAAPWNERPARIPRLMGPPPIVNRDLPMWLAFPLYRRVYGMGADVVRGMLPLSRRKEGADLDARITNRDMAVRFEEYPIEELRVPVLLLHARDDRVAPFEAPAGQVEGSLHRYPNLEKKIFETGGHFMAGHSEEIDAAVLDFIKRHE
jgi:alpha/beta hydrolase